ncbi:DUF6416 domain-containing protein [Mycobacterium sp. HM-7]
MWDKVSDTAKGPFSTLINHQEREFSGDELAAMLDISNGRHSVTGLLAWPGRRCFAVNRSRVQWCCRRRPAGSRRPPNLSEPRTVEPPTDKFDGPSIHAYCGNWTT